MNVIRLTQGRLPLIGAAMALSIVPIAQSSAQSYTLAARNASLQVNVDGSNGGLTDWTVNGVNQLQSQWFYYSIGSSPVNAINTIAPWTTPATTIGNFPTLTENYVNNSVSLITKYTLLSQPVGSLGATLGTTLTFQNLSGSNEVVNLFQYSNFGLGNSVAGQQVIFPSILSPYNVAQSSLSGATLNGNVTAISGGTQVPTGLAAGLYDGTQLGLGNGNPAPVFNNTSLQGGPGNVNYGYEFTATLAPNASLIISESQVVAVPEPSAMALISAGALALTAYARRRSVGGTK